MPSHRRRHPKPPSLTRVAELEQQLGDVLTRAQAGLSLGTLAAVVVIAPTDPARPTEGGFCHFWLAHGLLTRDHLEILAQALPDLIANAWERATPLQ